jgi:predicted lipoprotein with Yx(FWY)xxD motif
MFKRLIITVAGALVIGVGGAMAATSHAVGTARAGATVQVHSSRYGKVLFDGNGRVLYLFGRDRGTHSTCSGACAKAWPPFLTKDAPRAGAGITRALLGTTRRGDGSVQVTYAGHPLYHFQGDAKPGQIKCQNVSNFGGLWLIVRPSGNPVR